MASGQPEKASTRVLSEKTDGESLSARYYYRNQIKSQKVINRRMAMPNTAATASAASTAPRI